LGSAVFVGDEREAVEVGVEGAQGVDLGAVAGGGWRPPVHPLEAVAPLFEVAVDLVGRDRAGRPRLEPVGVAGDCVAVFAAGAGAARLPGEVGAERLEQTLVVAFRARPPRVATSQRGSFPSSLRVTSVLPLLFARRTLRSAEDDTVSMYPSLPCFS
jgi:hypothetical protein